MESFCVEIKYKYSPWVLVCSFSLFMLFAGFIALWGVIAFEIPGHSKNVNQLFLDSQRSIHAGMTMREAFDSGLADYMTSAGLINISGTTSIGKNPVGIKCARHLLNISFNGMFKVRVYCSMTSSLASQLIPDRIFKDKQTLLQALDTDYASWIKNGEFKIVSPQQKLFGAYDYFVIATNRMGRIDMVSPIIHASDKINNSRWM
jgi:hypothetical protein